MDARRSNWDGLQDGFCSKYRDICKKTNAADRPIRVIVRRDELIRASLDQQHLISPAGQKLPAGAGMQVAVEIHQGRRTVLEYLLSPVTKAVQEAGKEK